MATKTLKVNVTITILHNTVVPSLSGSWWNMAQNKCSAIFHTACDPRSDKTHPWRKHQLLRHQISPQTQKQTEDRLIVWWPLHNHLWHPQNGMLQQIKFITFITHIKPNNCFYVVLISCAGEYEQHYISPTIIFVPSNTCLPFWLWRAASAFIIWLHRFCVAPSWAELVCFMKMILPGSALLNFRHKAQIHIYAIPKTITPANVCHFWLNEGD